MLPPTARSLALAALLAGASGCPPQPSQPPPESPKPKSPTVVAPTAAPSPASPR